MAQDFYSVLGVGKNASADEIKKAYRKAARQFHPDVNPGDQKAEERFKQASAAFEILSDPKKRKLYDEFGDEAAKIGFDEKKAEAYRAYRAAQQGGAGGIPYGTGVDLNDLFGDIFGAAGRRGGRPGDFEDLTGGGGGRGAQALQKARGEDLNAKVILPLQDAVRGTERSLVVTRPGTCGTCKGAGAQGPVTTCPTCGGSGQARGGFGPLQFARQCPTCLGAGRSAKPCGACGGDGRVSESQRVTVKLPAGVGSGSRVRLAGQGAAGILGGPPGDLYIETEVEEHPLFRREGDDLTLEVPITVGEAVAGGEVRVPTFSGDVTVRIPPGSQSGKKMRVRGKGVPHLKGEGTGDLYLVLKIVVPQEVTEEVRAAAQQLDAAYGGDVRADLKI